MTRMMNSSSRSTFLQLFGFRRISHHGIAFLLLFLLSPAMEYVAAQPAREPPPRGPYNGFNQRFSPSMAIIIVVLITAFFFMGFFSIYIRQCSDRRNGGSIRQAVTGRSRRAPRGLDPAVVETFPTFLYSDVKGLKIGKGVLECAVCLIEFEDDVTLRLLPKCDHVFHPECIDAWLGSHTTCPVCRANLVPQPGELPGATLHIPDSDGDSDHENQGSDSVEPQDQVSIRVPEDQSKNALEPDVINPTQILNQNRPPRSRSVRTRLAGKFPRSHSTGHSLVQPGENCERFTLRLPEDVRRQVVNGKLNRSTSCVAFPRQASSRRGYRSGGDGSGRGGKFFQLERLDRSSKSDRWVFSSFFSRSGSARSPRKAVEGDATAGPAPRTLLTSVKTPFDCLGAKADEAEQSLSRPPV